MSYLSPINQKIMQIPLSTFYSLEILVGMPQTSTLAIPPWQTFLLTFSKKNESDNNSPKNKSNLAILKDMPKNVSNIKNSSSMKKSRWLSTGWPYLPTTILKIKTSTLSWLFSSKDFSALLPKSCSSTDLSFFFLSMFLRNPNGSMRSMWSALALMNLSPSFTLHNHKILMAWLKIFKYISYIVPIIPKNL